MQMMVYKINRIKKIIKKIPIAFTRNHKYDIETRRIIKRICKEDSNCIDIGTHEGEILDVFLKQSPKGRHFGFEPLPHLYEFLLKKYEKLSNVTVYDCALSNLEGVTEFNYVISNPAYSGIRKRLYDRKNEKDTKITVKKQLLDNVLPSGLPIAVIKADVEGGEMDVLEGAVRTIGKYSPIIIFEFGIGGSDIYGATPEKLYNFFTGFDYKIFLLHDFLKQNESLTLSDFEKQFYDKLNYYFIATKSLASKSSEEKR
jgi:FkbM family methyltransferase